MFRSGIHLEISGDLSGTACSSCHWSREVEALRAILCPEIQMATILF
jgi:hypothetical protein